MKKILIAVPSMDNVAAGFAQSLASLVKPEDTQCVVNFLVGSLIYDSRNKLAAQALNMDADYILWIDSDMIFNPDALLKAMADLDKGHDMVSGLYFRRVAPYTPVLFSELGIGEDGMATYSDYKDYPRELFEVAGCGFGFVLMKTDILWDIVDKEGPTWFTPLGNVGEDCAFCIRARRLGYSIMCDPNIKLGHVGHYVFGEGFYKAVHR